MWELPGLELHNHINATRLRQQPGNANTCQVPHTQVSMPFNVSEWNYSQNARQNSRPSSTNQFEGKK